MYFGFIVMNRTVRLTENGTAKRGLTNLHFYWQVPLQGFKALQGSTGAAGPRLFTLHLIEASTNNLPKVKLNMTTLFCFLN